MRLTLATGKRTTWVEVTRLEKLIRIDAGGLDMALELRPVINRWCSLDGVAPDQRLQFHAKGCGCNNSRIHYWTFPASMIDQYGPLPFTAEGETIRWRWWHYFGQGARFTVVKDDLREVAADHADDERPRDGS